MREKITLEKFRELVSTAKEVANAYSEEDLFNVISKALKDYNMEPILDEESFNNSNIRIKYEDDYEDYLFDMGYEILRIKQRELLSYDLSDIPFEEWKDYGFVDDGQILDLSQTKGNYDFDLISISFENNHDRDNKITLIGKECKIKNLQYVNFNKSNKYYHGRIIVLKENFDKETIDSNPSAFLENYPDELKEFIEQGYYHIDDFLDLSDESLDIIKNDPFFDELLINNEFNIRSKFEYVFLKNKEGKDFIINLIKKHRDFVEYDFLSFNRDTHDIEKIEKLINKSNYNEDEFIELFCYDAIINELYAKYDISRSGWTSKEVIYDNVAIDKHLKYIYPKIISKIKDDTELIKKIEEKNLLLDDFIKYSDLLSDPIFIYFTKDVSLKFFVTSIPPLSIDEEDTRIEKTIKNYRKFIENCKNFDLIREHFIKENELYNIYSNHTINKENELDIKTILFNHPKFSIDTINKFLDYYKTLDKKCQFSMQDHLSNLLYDTNDKSLNTVIDLLIKQTKDNNIDRYSFLFIRCALNRDDFNEIVDENGEKVIKLLEKYISDVNTYNDYSHLINIIINNSSIDITQQVIAELDLIKKILDRVKQEIFSNEWDIVDLFFRINSNYMTLNSTDFDKLKAIDKILNYIKSKKDVYGNDVINTFCSYIKKFIKNDNINSVNIDSLFILIERTIYSNSSEIRRLKEELINELSNYSYEEAIHKLELVEDIFLKNNLPYVGKIFKVFEVLHPDALITDAISPNLNSKKNPTYRKIVIFSDLIKCAIGSNNKSLIEYINSIRNGNEILKKLITNEININDLDDKDKETFTIYISHLNTLYNNTEEGKKNPRELKENIVKDSYELLSLFLKQERENFKVDELPDRIVRMFCHFAGIDSIDELSSSIESTIKRAHERNVERAKNNDFTLRKGDYYKGLANENPNEKDFFYKFFINILQNGSICKEFLGSDARSDTTPLDTDLSRIETDINSFEDPFNDSNYAAHRYGPLWLVLNDNKEKFNYSEETNEYDPNKLEIFETKRDGKGHYGIRTGFAASDIDYFVVDEERINMPRIMYSIVMNGFYIPVLNTKGNLVFTPEMYDNMRKDLYGLNYYGTENKYEFAPELDSFDVADEKYNIDIENNKSDTSKQRNIIVNALSSVGLNVSTRREISLNNGIIELIDTGSTGRGSNSSNDFDFDFIMRIDRDVYQDEGKLKDLKDSIMKALPGVQFESNYNIREQYVTIGDSKIKIDISIIIKDDKIGYTTDECIKDRLSCIEKIDPEKYKKALENIVLAKEVLKEAKCYKPRHAGNGHAEGGLGGVGVENWILEHGGSFEAAARSFIEVANNSNSFEEFKNKYTIWDFGENHMYFKHKDQYMHDEFVSGNMDENGYKKMKDALNKYINELDERRKNKRSNRHL